MELVVKKPPTSAEDTRAKGSIPGLGRFPGKGNSNLENSMDRGACWVIMGLHRVGHDWARTHTSIPLNCLYIIMPISLSGR